MNLRRPLLPALALAAALLGALSLPAQEARTKGPDPLEISFGQPVKLSDYLVPGKTTLFDFYSHFCPPCMALKPSVVKLHQVRPDLAVVEVNINRPEVNGHIDWQSPVAREYDLDSIPHFEIYGPDGKLVAKGDDAYGMVLNWIKAAGLASPEGS